MMMIVMTDYKKGKEMGIRRLARGSDNFYDYCGGCIVVVVPYVIHHKKSLLVIN